MIPLAMCFQSAEIDARTKTGALLADNTLMEIAAIRLMDALRTVLDECGALPGITGAGQIVALCGSGNNAGDALAVLRNAVFAGYKSCAAILCKDDPGELAAVHVASLRAMGIPVISWSRQRTESETILGSAGIILDGLSGTGLHGALRGPLVEALRFVSGLSVREKGGPGIVSVDLPSGLGDSLPPDADVMRADWTLAIEPRKRALFTPAFRRFAGEIIPVGGVLPADALRESDSCLLRESDLESFLPGENPAAYKGVRGRLAIFAGGEGTTGAASLCSRAALASGAGYVALHSEPEILGILASRLEEVMVRPNPVPVGGFNASGWDAVLAGPGWKPDAGNGARLEYLLSCGVPCVLDAGAIALYREFSENGFRPSSPVILTPHPGECANLCGCAASDILADPATILTDWAKTRRAYVVFKSNVTWIFSPEGEIKIWDGMEQGLGTAGSGDVLAGLTAGMVSRVKVGKKTDSGMNQSTASDGILNALCAAVISHGIAGRRLRTEKGWFAAGQIIESAAKVLGTPRFPFSRASDS